MRFEGTVTSWNDERGFGHIESNQGGEPIFVHIKAFQTRTDRPSVGMRVTFDVELGPKGKRALNVQVLRERSAAGKHFAPAPARAAARWALPAFLAISILAFVYYLAVRVWPDAPWWAPSMPSQAS